jgi:transposase-like protein
VPRERREQLVAAFRESGLTRRAFARREGIRYSTFCNWTQRASKRASAGLPAVAPVRFTEVALPTSTSGGALEVRLTDGTTVRGGSIEELAALVRALRS